jgi:hypothetical protein
LYLRAWPCVLHLILFVIAHLLITQISIHPWFLEALFLAYHSYWRNILSCPGYHQLKIEPLLDCRDFKIIQNCGFRPSGYNSVSMRNQILTFWDNQMYSASRTNKSDWPLMAPYPKVTGSSATPLRKPQTHNLKMPVYKKKSSLFVSFAKLWKATISCHT